LTIFEAPRKDHEHQRREMEAQGLDKPSDWPASFME
jgi:hypothetical protein